MHNDNKKEKYGCNDTSDINRMSLLACIEALEPFIDLNYNVTVYSNSHYVVEGVNDWYKLYYLMCTYKEFENRDLWDKLIDIIHRIRDVKFVYGKNNRANYLANMAIDEEEF